MNFLSNKKKKHIVKLLIGSWPNKKNIHYTDQINNHL